MSDKDALQIAGRELLDRIAAVMAKVDWAGFLELADMLPRARHTFVTGAGRSGLVARSFGMRLMHAGLPAFVPGETITPASGSTTFLARARRRFMVWPPFRFHLLRPAAGRGRACCGRPDRRLPG